MLNSFNSSFERFLLPKKLATIVPARAMVRGLFCVVHFVKCVRVCFDFWVLVCWSASVLFVVCRSCFVPHWCVCFVYLCKLHVCVCTCLRISLLAFVLFLKGVFVFIVHVHACSSGLLVVSVGLCTVRAICNMPSNTMGDMTC